MRKSLVASFAGAVAVATGAICYHMMNDRADEEDFDVNDIKFNDVDELSILDKKIYKLSRHYEEEAGKLLVDLIHLPADFIDGEPLCGASKHEKQRLDFLRQYIIDNKCVEREEDVYYDQYGNLIWTVYDSDDNVSNDKLKVVYLDGRSDTCLQSRENWSQALGDGIDPFNGLTDASKVDEQRMMEELKYLPPKESWNQMIFGRGAANHLQGIVSQVFSTKILLETKALGSLRGTKVISVATVADQQMNDNGKRNIIDSSDITPDKIPDCVILTNATGDIESGPCGLYIGQTGKVLISLEITGKMCHSSMPKDGINPLEFGSLIIAEAAEQARNGFHKHKFFGKGTRTAVKCWINDRIELSIPEKFTVIFDRRLTPGETPEIAIKELYELNSVKRAIDNGCAINISQYEPSGDFFDSSHKYQCWLTHPSNPAIQAAVESYKRTVSPNVEPQPISPENIPKYPRISHYAISTDGPNYLNQESHLQFSIENKHWLKSKGCVYPPIFGIGSGYEQHSHKVGEFVYRNHLWAPIAVISRFPSLFAQQSAHKK